MAREWVLPLLTEREAKTMLVNELVWALRNRPTTFSLGRYKLTDHLAEQEWWIANGAFGFGLRVPAHTEGPNMGWWLRRKAWKAVERWRRGQEKPISNNAVIYARWLMPLYDANRRGK